MSKKIIEKTYLINTPKEIYIADPNYYNNNNRDTLEEIEGLHYNSRDENKYSLMKIYKTFNEDYVCKIIIASNLKSLKEMNDHRLDKHKFILTNELRTKCNTFEVIVNGKCKSFPNSIQETNTYENYYGKYFIYSTQNDIYIIFVIKEGLLDYEDFESKLKDLFSCTEIDLLDNLELNTNVGKCVEKAIAHKKNKR